MVATPELERISTYPRATNQGGRDAAETAAGGRPAPFTVDLQIAFRVLVGSQAGALIVIHKWLKPVIPAWTAGIQSQGGESAGWCAS